MKIKIPIGIATGGGIFDPIDPPPPPNIDDFFQLDLLSASKTSFAPFEEIEIEWAISSKDPDTRFSDFAFSLVDTYGVLVDDLEPTGSTTFTPHRNTLVRVRGRRLGGTAPTTLGQGLALSVDEDNCVRVEIPHQLIDDPIFQHLEQLTSDTAEIRLRSKPEEPVATYTPGLISYDFPLEIIINNFFNADLDVTLEIRFTVDIDASGSELDVTVSHASDVDFSTFEDIASLGATSKIAEAIEKVLPLIFECQTREMERVIIHSLLSHPGVRRALNEGKRLLAVRVVPLGNFDHLVVILCAPPPEPECPG